MKDKDKEKRKLSFRQHLLRKCKIFFIAILILLFLLLIGYVAILLGGKSVVKEDELNLNATTVIETADGDVLGKLYVENRIYTPIETIPDHVQKAFLSIEDHRFYEHFGLDFKSIVRAVLKDIVAMSKVEGGSTITQQLAKNLFLSNDKTWSRKAKEAMAAIYLEQKLSKDEILELYLNEIYFGDGIYGIETAANYFFSKSISNVTVGEAALLAGLAKAPNGYSPLRYPDKALKRRNVVLQSMETAGVISSEVKQQEQGKELGLNIAKEENQPWNDSYIDLVIKEAEAEYGLSFDDLRRGGYRIVANVDKNIQEVVYKKFQESDYFPGNNEEVEGSFVMMENKSGKIVAAMGGRDYQLGNLNRTVVKRQPGSTLKPLAVYGPALMHEDVFTPFSIIPDQKMEIHDYMVSNADNNYASSVTIYDAIKESKNTSAVWLLNEIGIDYAKEYLSQLGMELEDNGLSLALGGLTYGVTPIQMMEGYSAFANEGIGIDSYTISRIVNQQGEVIAEAEVEKVEVFSPQVAWNMTEILAATIREGTAQAGNYPKALAGKTGSTEHPHVEGETKDAWFVGYTPEYVSALWMGYDHSDEENYLTGGSSYPTALTKSILTEIDKMTPLQKQFIKPNHVEDLPEPIQLPEITNLHTKVEFGGLSLLRGKLVWDTTHHDERLVYRIYREQEGVDERVGEVVGQTEYYLNYSVFHSNRYYVVPYDPLTKLEGTRSETVNLLW